MDYSILLPGVPVSSERGALGWCTVALVRHGDRHILFDTGSYGDRMVLLNALKKHDLAPEQIDDVFVSHLHFDHFVNADLFSRARIWVPERDLAYVREEEYVRRNDPYVPAAVVHHLIHRLTTYTGHQSIAEGLRVMELPGHTPGMSGLFDEKDRVLFAGDGVKNAWEFVNHVPPPAFFDADQATANYQQVWDRVDIVVPGHDSPFRITSPGAVSYLQTCTVHLKVHPAPDQDAKLIPVE